MVSFNELTRSLGGKKRPNEKRHRPVVRDIVPPQAATKRSPPTRAEQPPRRAPVGESPALPAKPSVPPPTRAAREDASRPEPDLLAPQPRPPKSGPDSRTPPSPPEPLTTLPSPNEKDAKPEEVLSDDLKVFAWEPDSSRRARRRRRMLTSAGVAALAVGIIVPTFVFPRFSIVVYPKIESVAVPRTEFSADPSAREPDAPSRLLPALSISIDQRLERKFPASGTKFIRERARGTVQIFNGYNSTPQALVANTRLQDPSGKIFRLAAGVTVPGARVAEGKIVPVSTAAPVIADAPGEAYNIGPTQFKILGFRGTPKYDAFSVVSDQPLAGGFEGPAKIVLADDIRSASEAVTRDVSRQTETELAKRLPADPDFFSPDGGREITLAELKVPQPGERFEEFSASAAAHGRIVAIRRSELSALLASGLINQSGLRVTLPPAQPGLAATEGRIQSDNGTLRFVASGRLSYWREPDASGLAATLRASTPTKAEAYLRGRDEIDSFRIKRFPSWLWFIPLRPGGLDIRIEPPRS